MWIYILFAVILIGLITIAIIYHDTHNFVVKSYDIYSDKVCKDYKFVLLSDLHGYEYGENNEKLKKAIDAAEPDAILCAGDMFVGHAVKGVINFEPGYKLLAYLASKYPVYMGNGNHERKIKDYWKQYGNAYENYRSRLISAGVIVLENKSVDIEELNIRISGLDLGLWFFKKFKKRNMPKEYLKWELGDSSEKKFQVLIAHNPQYFENYAYWGADFTVSGHVHGGIIRIPGIGGVISPAINLFPKYDGGMFEQKGRYMVLSRGLGTHGIHVRMFNPGELDIICIHKK